MALYYGNQRVCPTVKVGSQINNQDKTITQNGTYTADTGYTGLGTVEVNVSGGGDTGEKYLVRVIDYDGTILKEDHLDTDDTFTLPSQPSHDNLVFQSWSSPVTITNNTVTVTNSDIIIGPTYTTASGLSEFDITLTPVTGLSVTLNMNGTKNWGDGTSDTATTHTYSNAGNYTITCDGTTMTTSSIKGLFGQSTSVYNYYVTNVRFANITSIVDYVCQSCYSLTNITIPSSVTSIGSSAFQYCYSLTNITIPEGVTSIGTSAFRNCYSSTNITIPSSVTSIGGGAFSSCFSLTNITIPEGVTSISSAFQNCCSLTNITIPEGVTSIGSSAFASCYSLTNITIPEGVTSIGSNAFQGCYCITNITIPEGVTSIGSYVFSNCCSLANITIPEGVTSIGDNAFQGCYSITNITIPSSVTSIGSSAFQGCYSLTNITIPEGVTSISSSVFQYCYSITNITIPSSVTSIGSSAFQNCYSLIEYDFSSHTSVPTLSSTNIFNNINKICKIKVPASLEVQWKSATNWSTYADYITGV